jgi:RNA polymerase sigma factor (sigma-70 family)
MSLGEAPAPRRASPEYLAALLARHGSALELFARQFTTAPEDCVQEAFIELALQPQLPSNVLAWLYRVVRNRALNMARSQRRRRKREIATVQDDPDVWFRQEPNSELDAEQLTEALSALDEELREVVVARIWGGLSFEEIADIVETSISSAHRRFHSGLDGLRERLGLSWLVRKGSTPR